MASGISFEAVMTLTDENKFPWLRLLDSLDEEVCLHTADGRVLYANRRLVEAGGAAFEWLGRRCEEVFPAGSCPHDEAMRSKAPVQVEVEGADAAGRQRVTVVPLLGAAGEVEGFARISRQSQATL